MEFLIIFIIIEIIAALITFVGNNSDIVIQIIMFIFIGGLGGIVFTMKLHDLLISYNLRSKNYKKAIKLYNVKKIMSPNSKTKNAILINIPPLYFLLEENEEAKNILDKIDILDIKKNMLKGYVQVLFAYYYYKKENYEQMTAYLDASVNYDELFSSSKDLFLCAKESKTNKEKAKKLFKNLPQEEDYYIEPLDVLFLELKNSFA